MEFTIHNQVLLIIFLTAAVMGAVVNKTNFCTMGAVSDWVNMEDLGRMRAWLLAIAVAMLGVVILEAAGTINLPTNTFPPYRTANFAWLRYVLGGLMFGIGMTLGSGCGNKTLIRVGTGNLKSVFVLVVIAYMAYLMLWGEDPFSPGEGIFTNYFLPWLDPTTVDLGSRGFNSQELGALVGGAMGQEDTSSYHTGIGLLIGFSLLYFVFKSGDFRSSFDKVLGGTVVGLAVLIGWYVTGGSMGVEWKEYADFAPEIPSRVLSSPLLLSVPRAIPFAMDYHRASCRSLILVSWHSPASLSARLYILYSAVPSALNGLPINQIFSIMPQAAH